MGRSAEELAQIDVQYLNHQISHQKYAQLMVASEDKGFEPYPYLKLAKEASLLGVTKQDLVLMSQTVLATGHKDFRRLVHNLQKLKPQLPAIRSINRAPSDLKPAYVRVYP